MGGTYYTTVSIPDTPTMLESRLMYTQPQYTQQQVKMKPTSSQQTSSTYKSEAHRQLLTQVAQKAHTIPGVSNLGHPPDQTSLQTHLIAALCLLKPWQRCKLCTNPCRRRRQRTSLRLQRSNPRPSANQRHIRHHTWTSSQTP